MNCECEPEQQRINGGRELDKFALPLSVDGQPAIIYNDLTFAVASGVVINDGLNTFTTVVTSGNATMTNFLTQSLPARKS